MRLEGFGELTAELTKPVWRPVLTGDHDSGRLLKLDPATAAPHDHRGLLRMAGALFARTGLSDETGSLEGAAMLALSAGRRLPPSPVAFPSRQRGLNAEEAAPPAPASVARRVTHALPPGAARRLPLAPLPP